MWIYKAYTSNDVGSFYQRYFLKIDNFIAYRQTMFDVGIVCLLDIIETED